jgi:PTS system mannose-specific IIC component
MYEVILASFVGGLISLDRTAFLQVMVSQPLVAGTLTGFLLGDPFTGLAIGSVLELLWIGAVPVGSAVPPNETAAAVIASTIAILAGRYLGIHPLPIPLMVLSILLSIPLAVVGQRVDIFVRNYNRRFALNADRLLNAGDYLRIGRENLKGLLSFFMASFLSLMILSGSGLYLTEKVYPLIPDRLLRGFTFAFYLLLSIGLAVSIRTAKGKRTVSVLSAGILLGLVVGFKW